MSKENSHYPNCEFYNVSACLYKRGAEIERVKNEDDTLIGIAIVDGEQCRYDKCPYRYYVGTNRQNFNK